MRTRQHGERAPASRWWREPQPGVISCASTSTPLVPPLVPVVHSVKCGAIRASGMAVQKLIEGRKRVLDLGCNTGYLTTWYASLDDQRQLLGIDFSQACIEAAKAKAKKLKIRNARFQVADIDVFKSDTPFDAVVDTQTIVDIKDRTAALHRISSISAARRTVTYRSHRSARGKKPSPTWRTSAQLVSGSPPLTSHTSRTLATQVAILSSPPSLAAN